MFLFCAPRMPAARKRRGWGQDSENGLGLLGPLEGAWESVQVENRGTKRTVACPALCCEDNIACSDLLCSPCPSPCCLPEPDTVLFSPPKRVAEASFPLASKLWNIQVPVVGPICC